MICSMNSGMGRISCTFGKTSDEKQNGEWIKIEQIERIIQMESTLDACLEAVAGLEQALENYAKIQPLLETLTAYYHGPLWMKDFQDEREDRIPKTLKRGVLTEDAVWDLLIDHDRVIKWMYNICDRQKLLKK